MLRQITLISFVRSMIILKRKRFLYISIPQARSDSIVWSVLQTTQPYRILNNNTEKFDTFVLPCNHAIPRPLIPGTLSTVTHSKKSRLQLIFHCAPATLQHPDHGLSEISKERDLYVQDNPRILQFTLLKQTHRPISLRP